MEIGFLGVALRSTILCTGSIVLVVALLATQVQATAGIGDTRADLHLW